MASNDVRIKVSLDGADAATQGLRGIGDGASETDSKLGALARGGLIGVGKAFLALSAAAAAAGTAMGISVVKAYADYEQNLGGIETMFKDSADTMLGYAEQAYITAGLSANAYMSNVTSFSAALLQGLGGDTAAAADIANQAMIDMSDNANKFGSDITAIQMAYQGFAKQNYTMLDNLKLGYGGTAAEMARLINDSGVLGDSMEVTAATVNDVSFDKIIEAIHAIQVEMGVAGTTAIEASATISGSIGQLRGAWENLLTGLGDADADVATLAGNVITSFETVVANIAPVIETIGTHMADLGPKLGTMIESTIGVLFDAIPTVVNAGTAIIQDLLQGLLQGIVTALPTLITALVPALLNLVTVVAQLAPMLVTAGIDAIVALGQGIVQALPTLVPLAVQTLLSLVDAIITGLPMLLDVAIEIIDALATGILEALPTLVLALPDIIMAIVDFLIGAIPLLNQTGIDLLVSLIGELPKIINTLVAALPTIIQAIVTGLLTMIPQLILAGIKLITSLVTNLPAIIAGIIKAIPAIVEGIFGAFTDPKSIKEIAKAGLQLIVGLWNGINDAKNWLLGKIGGFVDSVISGIKDFFGIHSPSTVMKDEIGKWLPPGIGDGVEDNEDAALKPIRELNQKILAEAMALPDVSINRQFQTTSLATLNTQYAAATPRITVNPVTEMGAMFDLMLAELRAQPLEAQITEASMEEMASQVRRGLVSVRTADGREAQMAVMREVR